MKQAKLRGQTKLKNVAPNLLATGFAKRKVFPLITTLEANGYVTVADARKATDGELLAIRGIGPTGVIALRNALI